MVGQLRRFRLFCFFAAFVYGEFLMQAGNHFADSRFGETFEPMEGPCCN
jgi:hypothetical protein